MSDSEMNSAHISFTSSAAQFIEITWTIHDYSSLPDTPEDYALDSPSFVFANATWCLRLYPNRRDRTDLSLVRLYSLVPCHEIIYMLQAISGNPAYFPVIYSKRCYEENSRHCDWLPRRSKLITELAPDGTLVLMYHLFYEESINVHAFSPKMACKVDNSEISDVNDLQNSSTISLKSSLARSLKIMWKIPEYFSLPETLGYSMESTPFIFVDATWCLKLHPNGTEKDDLDTKISLVRLHSLRPCHKIIYVSDMAVEDERFCNHSYKKFSFDENRELDNRMDERSQLINFREKIAPGGNVTLFWHIFFEELTEKDTGIQKTSPELDRCKTVCQDLKNLLLSGEDYDFTLKVKDKEFRVHRNILKARSQVFQSKLTRDVIEKNSGVVDMSDCDPLAMEQFLLYMYCGKVDVLNENNMLGLYYAADTYNMMDLKEECRDFIRNSLSCSNICDVVQLALNQRDKNLLECATEFFVNNASGIITTEEWISFLKENEIAANELYIKASQKWTDAKVKR